MKAYLIGGPYDRKTFAVEEGTSVIDLPSKPKPVGMKDECEVTVSTCILCTGRQEEGRMKKKERLARIVKILEDVDQRCMEVDGPVAPTKEEITTEEIQEIYDLAKGEEE